jgi:tape measure domain-containing protein
MTAGDIVTRFVADLSGFSGGISRATRMASSFASTVGGHVRSVGSHFVNMGNSVLGSIKSVGQWLFFSKQVASTAMGIVSGFFAQNAAMEQTRVAFGGLLGSGRAADTMLRNLQKFAAATPFEFPELAKDSQMLLGMGVAARDVIPWMTAIGDAAAGVGAGSEGVEQVTRALGQMQAKGKVSGDEMMQLTEAGIPAWKILADSMHLSVAQVQNLSQQGKLGQGAINALVVGMERMYGGQMANQAMTFNGLMSTLKDNITMAFMAFAGPLFSQAKGALSSLTTLAGSPAFANFAKTMGETVGNALATAVRWLTELYSRLAANGTFQDFVQIAQNLGSILTGVVNGALLLLGVNLGNVGASGKGASDSTAGVANAIKQISDVIAGVTGFMSQLAGLFADSGVKGAIFRDVLIVIAGSLLAIKVINFAAAMIALLAPLPGIIAGFIGWAGAAWAAAAGMIAATWPILAIIAGVALLAAGIYLLIKNWGAVVAFLSSVWGGFVSWLNGTLSAIGGWFTARWNEISTFTVSVWNGIVTFLRGLWNTIVQVVTVGIRFVAAVMTGGSSEVVIGVISNWTQIRDTIMNIVNGIVGWIGARFNDFYNAVIKPLLPLVAWFNSLFETIGQIILKLVSIAVGYIQQKFNEAHTFIVSIWTTISNFLASIWDTIYSAIARVVTRLGSELANQWAIIQRGATIVWSAISTFLRSIWDTIYNAIFSVVRHLVSELANQWSIIQRGATIIWSAISLFLSQVWTTIYNTIATALNHLAGELLRQWNSIRDTAISIWTAITTWLTSQWNTLVTRATDFVNRIRDGLTAGFTRIRDTVTAIWRGFINGLIDTINGGISAVNRFANGIADGINAVAAALGVTSRVGHINIGLIPHLASGTDFFSGGPAIVGERGQELGLIGRSLVMLGTRGPTLTNLPRGTQVLPADKTQKVVQRGVTPHRIPGFAGGIGDLLGTVFNWVTQGVGSIAGGFLKQFNLNLALPGAFGDIAGGILNKVKGWLGDGINALITKAFGSAMFTGNLPTMVQRGMFLLPPGGGFHAPVWYNASGLHQGYDLQFPQGSPLREVLGGRVLPATGWKPWGGEIDVQLVNGLWERYLHLSAIFAKAGQVVRRGDLIGLTGGGTPASGFGYWSTGAHLHIQYDPGNYGMGIDPLRVWAAFGQFAPFKFARGGVIREPVAGIGLRSGAGYSFGENGPETVTPGTGRPVVFVLNIDGREFVRQVVGPNLQDEYRLYMKGGR